MSALWRLPALLVFGLGFGGSTAVWAAHQEWERSQYPGAGSLAVTAVAALGAVVWILTTWRRLPGWLRRVDLIPPEITECMVDLHTPIMPILRCNGCGHAILPVAEAMSMAKMIMVMRLHAQLCTPKPPTISIPGQARDAGG